MRRRMFRFLLVAMLVASGLVFTGGEVRAATFSYSLSTTPVIPTTVTTSRSYEFEFTPTAGTLAIGNIDLEIPGNIVIPVGPFAGSTSHFSVSIKNGATLSGEVYDVGIGDFGTKFGIGDTRFRVMKINTPSLTTSFTLVLNIFNQNLAVGMTLGTEKGTVLIKAGNGSNTQSFSFPNYNVYTPAIVQPTGPSLSNISVSPNPILPPQCATVTWSTPTGTTVDISWPQYNPAQDCVVVNNGNNSALVCIVNEGTYTLTITAMGSAGFTSTATTTIVVSPPPLIETTCKQIRKNPLAGNPSCIYLCLNTIDGVKQDIQSATWFSNGDCDPQSSPGIPLTVYGQDAPEKTLVCAPCLYQPADPDHPQACTTNTDASQTPFLYVQSGVAGNPYKNCDVFRFEQQDQGFAAVLGNDPWIVVNGRMVWTR